jgi:VanZ family protein
MTDTPPAAPPTPARRLPLRAWPFVGASGFTIVVSALAPDGRKPFFVDTDLGWDALAFSLAKDPHIGAAALLALLAVIATGRDRLLRAFVLTVAVGACWELGQTTVIGHTSRLADLAPDAVGALLGCAWGVLVTWLVDAGRADLALGGPRATSN